MVVQVGGTMGDKVTRIVSRTGTLAEKELVDECYVDELETERKPVLNRNNCSSKVTCHEI